MASHAILYIAKATALLAAAEYLSSGRPASAWPIRVGITIPYLPVCRGPTVLNSLMTTTGSFLSFQ